MSRLETNNQSSSNKFDSQKRNENTIINSNNIGINFNINNNIVKLRPELDRFVSFFDGEKKNNIKENNGKENQLNENNLKSNIMDFSFLVKNNIFKEVYNNKKKINK